jgi:putative addiction module antidote
LSVVVVTRVKIQSVGNSLGVVLPNEVLARLHLKNSDSLQLSDASDGSMRTTPSNPDSEAQMRIGRRGMARFREALRELAGGEKLTLDAREGQ